MNNAGSTARAATPDRVSRSNQVGNGCHSACGGSSRHWMWVSTRSVPGTLRVKPRMPCSPGCAPVPSDTRLLGVVDGKVQVSSVIRPTPPASTEASNGALPASLGNKCQPMPSTSTTATRSTCSATDSVTAKRSTAPGTPSSAAAAGSTSQREPDGGPGMGPVWHD